MLFSDLNDVGGPNSSVGKVLGALTCLMQCLGFDPPLRRIFVVEEIKFFPWS